MASAKKKLAGKRKRPEGGDRRPQDRLGVQALKGENQAAKEPKERLVNVPAVSEWPMSYWIVGAFLVLLLLFSYWPTILWMADLWYHEPDYSHGWFVPILALSICWNRAASFPGAEERVSWQGLWLVGFAILLRIAGRFAYADFMDAWSILFLLAGGVWCLFGKRALWWALPAIGFLIFAVPLPYRAETMMSWQLQGVATEFSKFWLRVLGQPAVSQGHIVWIGSEKLVVEQACSGLRIFVGMMAFAFYWAAMNQRAWADRVFLILAAIPAALLVNSLRITLIGLLYPFFSSEEFRFWIHEISGIMMLFASFAIMGCLSWYWQQLYRPEEKITAGEMLRGSERNRAKSSKVVGGQASHAG